VTNLLGRLIGFFLQSGETDRVTYLQKKNAMLSARPLPMSAVINLYIYADLVGGSFVSVDIWSKIGSHVEFPACRFVAPYRAD
jgi:hypothetical protein